MAEQYHRVINLFSVLIACLKSLLLAGGGGDSIMEGKNKNGKWEQETEILTGEFVSFTHNAFLVDE